MAKAKLVLKDGSIFEGLSFGNRKSTAGEVVFATGMVGYEQSLTDPSYAGQILTFTYPLIGNWGIPKKSAWESDKIQVAGLVISDLATKPNHHLMVKTLDAWMKEEGIVGIYGIDTRALAKKLREKGVMLGKIIVDKKDVDFWNPNEENLIAQVSIKEVKIHRPNSKQYQNSNSQISKRFAPKIALVNCGAKENIKRNLFERGATIYELPWNYDPFENNLPIDGIVISNGPGDPKIAKETIAIVKRALNKKMPIFGICLGNQILALAAGGNTFKLKFGHRAQNQPTIQIGSLPAGRRCYITTQNHGFSVSEKKLPAGFRRWFYNANDNTNEGLIHEKLPFFSVQFHPESAPGPYDTTWLFDYYMKSF